MSEFTKEFIPYSAKRSNSKCQKAGEIEFLIQCPNMKDVDGDLDMEAEHYKCDVCGERKIL